MMDARLGVCNQILPTVRLSSTQDLEASLLEAEAR